MVMKKYIVANWKMYGTPESTKNWAQQFLTLFPEIPDTISAIVCPPATLLAFLKEAVSGSQIHLGGQDCHTQKEGAYTGGISASMLKDAGCEYVIVGHSERRAYCNESNDIVREKSARAINTGLIPIICIGETQEQRASGKTIAIINQQIDESIPNEASAGNFILAYEPIWAIGSGNIPTINEIKQVHAAIITAVFKRTGVDIENISVLYGGSVKPDNAGEILAIDEVSGVLVGGASLKADDFCKIISSL